MFQDGFRFGKQAHFNETSIIGRSSPIITYGGSSSLTLDVTLELYSDGLGDGAAGSSNLDDIIMSLLALTYPKQSGIQPAPLCQVTIGSLPLFQNWKCVCNSVDPHYGSQPIWTPNGTARMAQVVLKFTGIELASVDASTINRAGSFKQNSFKGLLS